MYVRSAEMVQFMQAGAYPNVVQFIEDNDALMFDERRYMRPCLPTCLPSCLCLSPAKGAPC